MKWILRHERNLLYADGTLVYLNIQEIKELMVVENEGLFIWTTDNDRLVFPCSFAVAKKIVAEFIAWAQDSSDNIYDIEHRIAVHTAKK